MSSSDFTIMCVWWNCPVSHGEEDPQPIAKLYDDENDKTANERHKHSKRCKDAKYMTEKSLAKSEEWNAKHKR